MRKIILAVLISMIILPATAQKQRKISTHIEFIQQFTISDRTIKLNQWGSGLGLQTMLYPKARFSPLVDVSGILYISKIKIAYVDENENVLPDVNGLVNLFAGAAYKPNSVIYFSVVGGPSFVSDQTLFGIKPAVGFYFSPTQKWKAQLAYLNIFNRGIEGSKKNFESVALSIGMKLF